MPRAKLFVPSIGSRTQAKRAVTGSGPFASGELLAEELVAGKWAPQLREDVLRNGDVRGGHAGAVGLPVALRPAKFARGDKSVCASTAALRGRNARAVREGSFIVVELGIAAGPVRRARAAVPRRFPAGPAAGGGAVAVVVAGLRRRPIAPRANRDRRPPPASAPPPPYRRRSSRRSSPPSAASSGPSPGDRFRRRSRIPAPSRTWPLPSAGPRFAARPAPAGPGALPPFPFARRLSTAKAERTFSMRKAGLSGQREPSAPAPASWRKTGRSCYCPGNSTRRSAWRRQKPDLSLPGAAPLGKPRLNAPPGRGCSGCWSR